MGIQGLLRFLKDATSEIHIREYAGRCVAVDTYCWLHRGAFACADKLAKGEKTDQYVKYCMKFVDMLESYNVRPILVFDGCRLPSKKEVEKQRRERRELYMQKGRQFLREGRPNDARDAFTKCISVTPQMALAVMKVARERGVDCIVAPYEADAQLAFLLKHGYVQAVITEDSDLLCFGCERVILKMDLTGRAQEVSLDRLENVKNLQGFTPDTFRHMCILSGCDYLPSIKGIGLVKACKALKLAKNKDIFQTVRRLHQYIKGLRPVEADYVIGFDRADKTFLYQLVLDPKSRKIVPLNLYPPDVTYEEVKYAGPLISNCQGLQIAWGNVDINTGKQLGNFDADKWLMSKSWNGDSVMCRTSIWNEDFVSEVNRSAKDDHPRKTRKLEMPLLRGREAVIDINNMAFSRKQKTELLAGEDVLELCSSNGEKKRTNLDNGFRSNAQYDQEDLVNIYKASEPIVSPRKLSLRKRMRAKTNGEIDCNTVVKSRFFSTTVDAPSFIEESETTISITKVDEAHDCPVPVPLQSRMPYEEQVTIHDPGYDPTVFVVMGPEQTVGNAATLLNGRRRLRSLTTFHNVWTFRVGESRSKTRRETTAETPETSNSSFTHAAPTLDSDGVLHEILQEMETSVKAEPRNSKEESSFSVVKSPKKQEELLVKLKMFQRQNDARLSLPSWNSKKTSEKQKVAITQVKRRNPFAVSSTKHSARKSSSKRKSSSQTSPMKRFKRTVIKPPNATNHPEKDVSPMEDVVNELNCDSSSEPKKFDASEESITESVHDSSHVSSEDIPILDKNAPSRTISNIYHEEMEENASKSTIKKMKISVSPRKTSTDRKKTLQKSVNLESGDVVENVDKSSPKDENNLPDPIVLSSDEETENIPYIDGPPEKPKKRKISIGLNKNTPPQPSTGLIKSKYFSGAKASGLRKKGLLPKKKTKNGSSQEQILKCQPKITSIFLKTVPPTNKTRRKPLSPSKLENEIDHTPETTENDVSKIKAKMLATRKLFNQTPKTVMI